MIDANPVGLGHKHHLSRGPPARRSLPVPLPLPAPPPRAPCHRRPRAPPACPAGVASAASPAGGRTPRSRASSTCSSSPTTVASRRRCRWVSQALPLASPRCSLVAQQTLRWWRARHRGRSSSLRCFCAPTWRGRWIAEPGEVVFMTDRVRIDQPSLQPP